MLIKKINWKTFLPDFLRIQVGFVLYGAAIALFIRAGLGTNSWAVLDVALSKIFKISPGTMTVIVGFIVLGIALIFREQVGWGTLANILSIGPYEDAVLSFVKPVTGNLPVQFGMFLFAIAMMGLASAIYIGVDAGAGPRDTLMLAINRNFKVSIRVARTVLEVAVVAIGWYLGGPAGLGTVLFALLIGPSVQWSFKLLKVDPHKGH
jgi:uncharacterized membrane protein YczE